MSARARVTETPAELRAKKLAVSLDDWIARALLDLVYFGTMPVDDGPYVDALKKASLAEAEALELRRLARIVGPRELRAVVVLEEGIRVAAALVRLELAAERAALKCETCDGGGEVEAIDQDRQHVVVQCPACDGDGKRAIKGR